MPQNKTKKTKYMGKNITYKNVPQLAKKIKGTRADARKLVEGRLEVYIGKEGVNMTPYNVSESPLKLREFGINKINRSKLLSNNARIKDITIRTPQSFTDDERAKYNLVRKYLLKLTMTFKFSIERVIRIVTREFIGTLEQVKHGAIDYAHNGYIQNTNNFVLEKVNIEFLNVNTPIEMDWKQGEMFKEAPLSLQYYYNNVDLNSGGDCVRRYLKLKYKKMSFKTIDKFFINVGVSTNEILEFCKHYSICLNVFGLDKTKLLEFIPEKINKSYGSLNYIKYDNHLYPLVKGELEKKKFDSLKIEIVDNANTKLLHFIEDKKVLPADIKYNGLKVYSFIVDEIKYIENDQYLKCKEILDKFEMSEHIYDSIKVNDIFNIIEKKYLEENIKSFWPKSQQYSIEPLYYKTDEDFNKDDITTIDNNKHFTFALSRLPFLLRMDYRCNKINDYTKVNQFIDPLNIVDRYFYMVKPQYKSRLLESAGPYTGYYLKYCIEKGLKFNIREEMTTEMTKNYYTKMIEDLDKNIEDKKVFKDVMNIGIGKMQMGEHVGQKIKVKGIYNLEESNTLEGYKDSINKDYNIVYEFEDFVKDIYTKKPIAIQILLESKRIVYEKMEKLGLKESDIIQIHTDSITYKGKKPNDLDYGVGEWKEEEYKPVGEYNDWGYEAQTFYVDRIETNTNENYDAMAGYGKTYKIINEIIPTLKESFIILSPTHEAVNEYREHKINCGVIQKYTLCKEIPKEQIIIIDEVGMIDKAGQDLIYKCTLLNKKVISAGDYRQLLPFKTDMSFNSEHYLRYMYEKQHVLETNYRNDFTREYYEALYNGNLDLVNEVKKYRSKDYLKSDIVICYRNEKGVEVWNKKIMEELGLNKYSIGLKVKCNTNVLSHHDIYNNFKYTIKNVTDTHITLSDDKIITKHEYDKNFMPAYALTLYGMQGKSINSFYYPDEELSFINSRSAYTLISRLKTK